MPVRTRTVMVRAVGETCRFYSLPAKTPCAAAWGRTRRRHGRGKARAGGGPDRGLGMDYRRSVAVLLVQGLLEIADLALGMILLPAVALLQLAGQVLGIALGHVEHVVGEVAPLGLHLALQLLPVASDDVAVHACSLVGGSEPGACRVGDSIAMPAFAAGPLRVNARLDRLTLPHHRPPLGKKEKRSHRWLRLQLHLRTSCARRILRLPVPLELPAQHLPSLQSWALSSSFSPPLWMSLPAPAMVLQAVRAEIENRPSRVRATMRFIRGSHRVSCPHGMCGLGATFPGSPSFRREPGDDVSVTHQRGL